MQIVGDNVFKNANIAPAQVEYFDIYSCFPIAVRLACEEMRLPLDIENDSPRLTVTGGLPFHGGPGNNYVTHSLVAMVELVRNNAGTFGLVTGNGGVLSKHAATIISTEPYTTTHGDKTWSRADCKADLDKSRKDFPNVECVNNPGDTKGIIKNYTITYKAGSVPVSVLAIGELVKGERFVAVCEEKNTVQKFHQYPDAFVGVSVDINTQKMHPKRDIYRSTFNLSSSSNL